MPRAGLEPATAGQHRIRFPVIAGRHGAPFGNAVITNVDPTSIIFTDDWPQYSPLTSRYADQRVINHSEGINVRGDTYTNTIEGASGT